MQGPVTIAALLLLAACHQSSRDKEATQQREREERFDATLQRFTTQHRAIRFETREPDSMFRKLTIDAQDSIAATPTQLYWSISDQFDIYRDASGPHLFFRAISDHWVSLSCTDAQVAEIRKHRRPDRTFVSFALAYTLRSASPIHVELRAATVPPSDIPRSNSLISLNGAIL